MPTILQISDAHLSRHSPLFRENLARIQALAEEVAPDLIVATGDLSLDGADREDDLAFAAELHAAFTAPLLALPGNHDVGSHARTMPHQPIDPVRLERFRAHLGPGRGVVDMPGWRIIGLNSEVMGTGLDEESAQAAALPGMVEGAGDRRIALFLHKPVFVTAPDDPTFDYWSVPPAARATLAPLLDHPSLRLVGSGHLHLHHRFERGRTVFAWAPALSFVVHPDEQPGLPGERLCGALVHRLHDDHAETQLLAPDGLDIPLLDDIRHLTYPRQG